MTLSRLFAAIVLAFAACAAINAGYLVWHSAHCTYRHGETC